MISVALYQPEIPPNTGNAARLCAAVRVPLHIVGRAGFQFDDRAVRRAGLDYWPHVTLHHHRNLDALEAMVSPGRILCFSARNGTPYTQFHFEPNDCLLFGPESSGLPPHVVDRYPGQCLTIPMLNPEVRSLNLATAVGIALYEALRQNGVI